MSDIYIIYAREDRLIAKEIYGLLSEPWDTWWDDYIVGPYNPTIEEEIQKTSCVVALFTEISRDKDTVLAELELARRYKKPIIPIQLGKSEPTYPYNINSKIDLQDWKGEADHPEVLLLKIKISTKVAPNKKPRRLSAIANDRIPLPTFFPSVSSHETQLIPSDAVAALRIFEAPNILVSAYDLDKSRAPEEMLKELTEYRDSGGFVLIDSGYYEAFRLKDKSWNADSLKEVLSHAPHDWAFCFDGVDETGSRPDPALAVEQIINAVERDSLFTSAPVIPIVHALKLEQGERELYSIQRIVREVAVKLNPPLIGIPERDLGFGLIERAKTVLAIRQELSQLPFYQPIHILGTGNPWTIPVLAAAGADTFDGLEWCRMVVDRASDRLHHFQHFDLFINQIGMVESPVARVYLENEGITFSTKAVFHNLDYYDSFIREMRKYFNEDNIEAFLVYKMGQTARQFMQKVPGLCE